MRTSEDNLKDRIEVWRVRMLDYADKVDSKARMTTWEKVYLFFVILFIVVGGILWR